MNIVMKPTVDLIPYENNPRHNETAVRYVAESIRQFGFKVPIIIDANNVIVAGHTRLKAAEELGIDLVPCLVADDLTEEQVKAYRLADNKVSEFSQWDFEALEKELDSIDFDMTVFGFDVPDDFEFDENDLEKEDEKNGNVQIQITFANYADFERCEDELKRIAEANNGETVVRMV